MYKFSILHRTTIPFPVQNGSSSVQNRNSPVLSRKIIMSIEC